MLSISAVNCNTRCDVREDVFPATEDSMPAREDTALPLELAEEILLVDMEDELEVEVEEVEVEEMLLGLSADTLFRAYCSGGGGGWKDPANDVITTGISVIKVLLHRNIINTVHKQTANK